MAPKQIKPTLTDDYVHLVTEQLRKDLDAVTNRYEFAKKTNKQLTDEKQKLNNQLVKLQNNNRILNNQIIVLKKEAEKMRLKEKKTRLENQKLTKVINRAKQLSYISPGT